MNRRRIEKLELLKQQTRIGIFGSFYESYKKDLLGLQRYLHDDLGYHARLSENMLDLLPRDYSDQDEKNYALSEVLIENSDIHILVFPNPKKSDPHHLTQSVSIEYTLIKERKKPYVVILCQKGLRDNAPGSFGGVMKGSLKIVFPDFEAEIIDYESLEDTHPELIMICHRFLMKIHQ